MLESSKVLSPNSRDSEEPLLQQQLSCFYPKKVRTVLHCPATFGPTGSLIGSLRIRMRITCVFSLQPPRPILTGKGHIRKVTSPAPRLHKSLPRWGRCGTVARLLSTRGCFRTRGCHTAAPGWLQAGGAGGASGAFPPTPFLTLTP